MEKKYKSTTLQIDTHESLQRVKKEYEDEFKTNSLSLSQIIDFLIKEHDERPKPKRDGKGRFVGQDNA